MWWREGVLYQIYVRSFQDSDGDGVGDLQGIVDRLDHLPALGVDALWLTPFYPSPMKDFGYDISDHSAVHPLFGDLETFDRLVSEARRRGLKVLVDFVPNHTSDEHPWFQEARFSRQSPKRDWYVWADPKPDGSPPNNWLSAFGGSGWTFDEETGQYYRHSFLSSMPDLNWRNPEVRAAMFDVLRFWLDRGVDGFRVDAAQFPMKDPEMRDNPPNTEHVKLHRPLGEWDTQVHEHDLDHADIHDVYKEMRSVLGEYGEPGRVAIGEVHIFDWPRWGSYFGSGADEFHMVFNFGLLGVEWEARALLELITAVEEALPEGAWPNWAVGNHDEPRVASRLGDERARLAMLLQFTLRGTPTLYYGDELGLPDVAIAPGEIVDPWGFQAPELSRDPERSPMPWSREANGGFTVPEARPWLPRVPDLDTYSGQAQAEVPGSFLTLTKEILATRRASPALRRGEYVSMSARDDVFVFERHAGDDRRLIALNLGDAPTSIEIPFRYERVELSTRGKRTVEVLDGHLELAPLGGYIVGDGRVR